MIQWITVYLVETYFFASFLKDLIFDNNNNTKIAISQMYIILIDIILLKTILNKNYRPFQENVKRFLTLLIHRIN